MAEPVFKRPAETRRDCSAPAETLADLATVTKLPRTASSVCLGEARSEAQNAPHDRIATKPTAGGISRLSGNGFEARCTAASLCSKRAMILIYALKQGRAKPSCIIRILREERWKNG